MGLGNIAKKQAEKRETAHEENNEAFRMRLASQQFLKHHGPLLRAFVRAGGDPKAIVQPGAFEERARQARSLAVAIAAHTLGKAIDQVSMHDARHFRFEAAEVIAQAWDAGIDLDIDKFASEIATAVTNADEVYDGDTIAWAQISANGSVAMTAASISLSLASVVSIYDFRAGERLVLSTLTAAVVEATRQAVDTMTAENSTAEDRRSLSQTTMRSFTGILAQIYEESARVALNQLVPLTEPKRRAWLRSNAPLESVLTRFSTWTSEITQVAAAAARETLTSARPVPADPKVS